MCLNPGESVGGHYQIERTLGRGGIGQAYLAKDIRFPTKYWRVIKEITPRSNEPSVLQEVENRFNREAQTLEQLGHHNQIPEFFGCFQENGKFYLVHEYIEGDPLSQELTVGKHLSENDVIDLLKDILEVLKVVHEQHYIHRDINPSNLIRRNQDRKIVLIDFGAVKEISTLAANASGQAGKSKFFGTQGYIPIEQAIGRPELCSDIYAVGMVGIQALTGLDPSRQIQTDRIGEILWQNWASQASPGLVNILNKMVRQDCNQRYQSAAEALEALQSLSRQNQTSPITTVLQVLLQRKYVKYILLGIVTALIVIIAGFLLLDKRTEVKIPQAIPQAQISYGEKGLISNEKNGDEDSEFNVLKNQGIDKVIAASKATKDEQAVTLFQEAATSFEQAIKKNRNAPESLIYLNNARIGKKKAHTIAVVAPISNELNGALEMLRGVAQAQDEINKAGGINGVPLKVAIANDDDNPETAQQIASALISQPEVLGVVGHYSSDATLKAGEKYDSGKLVTISSISTAVKLSGFSPYVFRTVPNDAVAAKALANYMLTKLQHQKAAVFFNSKSEYSKSLKLKFIEEIVANVGDVDRDLEFDLSSSNFIASESVKKAISKKAQVLMLAPNTDMLDKAFLVIKANNKQLKLLGGDSVYSPKTLAEGGEAGVGMVVAVAWHIDASSESDFPRRSKELWRDQVNWRTAMSYDATQALIEAIKRDRNPTRQSVQKALSAPDFVANGASGTIRFLSSGDRIGKIQLVEVRPDQKSKTGYNFFPLP